MAFGIVMFSRYELQDYNTPSLKQLQGTFRVVIVAAPVDKSGTACVQRS